MSDLSQAILSSWSFEPQIAIPLLIAAAVYFRGWRILTLVTPKRFPAWRLYAFIGGLASFWIAVASPLDALAGLLLSTHMVQHLLLIAVSPPLILLGAPLLPLLRGLPRSFSHDGLGPFLGWPALSKLGHGLAHPASCWFAMAVTLCVWHIPAAFELALHSPGWHRTEHLCFFVAALLFWWPVVQPYPSLPRWPLWFAPLYLFLADLLNTAISAILTFSERVIYPTYADAPRLFGTTALGDQAMAGLIMWVPGSLVFLVPAVGLAVKYLSPSGSLVRPNTAPGQRQRLALTAPEAPAAHRHRDAPFDLLTVPILGPFLRAQVGRRTLQIFLLVVAIAVVADGFWGPQLSSVNLAGVLPWTYWRAFTVVALLSAGNLFCMACPFTLPREAARHLGFRPRNWPRALRSKWIAAGLIILFFWAYEVFGLWDHPAWTAGLIVAYFVAAFAVDAFFRGASFCKFICPIGQFHFVSSLVSPLEVKVRHPDLCTKCTTHDCLQGTGSQLGCQTNLFLPSKIGNLDCTFCLDCVRACPHENVGVLAVYPGMEVLNDTPRSSVGQLSRRPDVAALAAVIVFAAFANAALMVAPVTGWRDSLAGQLGLASVLPVTTAVFLISLVLAPAILIGGSVLAGRSMAGLTASGREIVARYALALVPLGLTMWVAHFSYHLATSWHSIVPAAQRAAKATGLELGRMLEVTSGPAPSSHALLAWQILVLDAGLILSLYLGWRLAREYTPRIRSSLRLLAPWAGVAGGLYSVGIWILLQPMQMRGM